LIGETSTKQNIQKGQLTIHVEPAEKGKKIDKIRAVWGVLL
jgi:hypothetical protein